MSVCVCVCVSVCVSAHVYCVSMCVCVCDACKVINGKFRDTNFLTSKYSSFTRVESDIHQQLPYTSPNMSATW